MQQPITRRDVYEPVLGATINGEQARLESVRIDRELPDPFAGGAMGADGTVVAVTGPDVTDRVPTPWDPGTQWPPVPESPVSVAMDTSDGAVSLMGQGRVVSADGGTGRREAVINVADRYQTLDRPISWDAWTDAMPALTEATNQRLVSLRASAVTDKILRHCGWYATPPRLGGAVLSVPAMGTMWPEWGTCVTSTRADGQGYPQMFTEPWGVGVIDVRATYNLAGTPRTLKEQGRIELTAIAGRPTGSTMLVEAQATGANVRLSWNDTLAYVWVTNSAGTTATVISRPRSAGSFLYATVEYVTDTSVRVTLRVDGVASEVTVACRSQVTTSPYTTARILGEGCGGGFQIAFPNSAGTLSEWTRNAVIYDRGGSFNALEVVPPVQGENCADLLRKQCEAQAATFWIDETGVLRWWDLARLENRSNVATLTSDRDITEDGFQWQHSRSSVKRSVTVEWKEPVVAGGWRTDVDLWQGSGSTISTTGANNPVEDWINVPNDEVWIMPDLTASRVGDSYGDFNYGWGTWYGGITDAGSMDTDHWAQLDGSLLWSIERVTDSAFKTTLTWTGSKQATQRTLDAESRVGTGLWRRRCDFDLPILRGKKKYTLGDQSTTASQTGPTTAPDHVIDAGWWIQNATQAAYTANYAAARLTVAQPVLSSIAIVPLPGLQIGDMVTVIDTTETRLTIQGVVVADYRTADADMNLSHAVAVRPVAVSRNGVEWQEWGAFVVAEQHQTWGQRQQPDTWQTWGSDPLEEE